MATYQLNVNGQRKDVSVDPSTRYGAVTLRIPASSAAARGRRTGWRGIGAGADCLRLHARQDLYLELAAIVGVHRV